MPVRRILLRTPDESRRRIPNGYWSVKSFHVIIMGIVRKSLLPNLLWATYRQVLPIFVQDMAGGRQRRHQNQTKLHARGIGHGRTLRKEDGIYFRICHKGQEEILIGYVHCNSRGQRRHNRTESYSRTDIGKMRSGHQTVGCFFSVRGSPHQGREEGRRITNPSSCASPDII